MLGAAALLPWKQLAKLEKLGAAPVDLTTLNQTIVKGVLLGEGSRGDYFRLAAGPGEPYVVRTELASPGTSHVRNPRGKDGLLNFVHFTDIHFIDAQSPARVEFLDRFADPGNGCESIPFSSAQRPQELLSLHTLEAMIRRIREVAVSPQTGRPFSFVVCTGDNTDNEQFNELRWFIDAMDGGSDVSINSGGPDYEGVQKAEWADPEYWHPDEGIADKYKQQWGYPEYPGLLEEALVPVGATGIGLPWLQTFGNHDGLMQGNAPRNSVFEAIAVGATKVMGPPPGVNPCDSFQTLQDNPAAFLAAPMNPITADPARRVLRRAEYIAEMFQTTGTPVGHGFTQENLTGGTAYWHDDDNPGFRLVGLDTVHPGGESNGSIGAAQFEWLEERLREVSSHYFDAGGNETSQDVEDRLVVIVSHHGLRSLNNPVIAPDPLEPGANDLPRVMADEIEALVHRFPNVIAWVSGHTHDNVVVPRTNEGGGGFWDIGTAAHIDWPCQSRLIEVMDNKDGTLSIYCTMVDHGAPLIPGGTDPVLNLASISRELSANDFQHDGFDSHGPGHPEDRNVELLIAAPFPVKHLARRAALTSA
jgi:metallophosphoesterase (TIGR03767 family)